MSDTTTSAPPQRDTTDTERRRAAAAPTTYILEECIPQGTVATFPATPETEFTPQRFMWVSLGEHEIPGGTRRATALLMCISQHPDLKQRCLTEDVPLRLVPADQVYAKTVGPKPAPAELEIRP